MGIAPLFCCFRGITQTTVAIIGLVFDTLGIGLLTWGLIKTMSVIFSNKFIQPLYFIGYYALYFSFPLFIVIVCFSCCNERNNCCGKTKRGRFYCLTVFIMCIIHIISIFISHIYIFFDKKKEIEDIEENEKNFG